MKILFDGPYQSNPNAGVLLYFNLLAKFLSQSNLVYFSRTNTVEHIKVNIFTPVIKHYRPHKFFFYVEYIWFLFFGPKRFDIVHTIEHSLSPTGRHFVKNGAKHAITIYDLIHEIFGAVPNLYDKHKREIFYKNSDGFIFISNSTKRDFNNFYSELIDYPNRLIYLASKFVHTTEPEFNSRPPNFLYVGSRDGYKDFNLALKIFTLLLAELPNAKLVVCGSPPNENEQTITHNIKNSIEWILYPNDNELKDAFLNSYALLYTSSYEGFGLPLLEAMSNGCIPVARNHSSIPEVMGNAGIYLDDDYVNQTIKYLIEVFYDGKKHELILHNGYEQASNFTWSKTAHETIKFYKFLLKNKKAN